MNIRQRVKAVLPKSLLGRALMIIVTPAVLLQVWLAFIFYENHWDLIARRLAGAVVAEIALVIDIRDRLDATDSESLAAFYAMRRLGLQFRMHEGEVLPDPLPEPGRDTLSTKLAEEIVARIERPFTVDADYGDRQVEIRIQLENGVLQVIAPRERLFSFTTYVFVIWMVGTSIILFTIAIIFMRNQIRPIRRLARAVDRFGKGQQVGEFRPQGASEVRQAARAFGLMRDRIQRQMQQRTEMLAGVSHDLKTPLTRMRLQLAMLGDGPDVDDLRRDIGEMESMIEGYLAFARGEGEEPAVETDIDPLLEDLVAGARRQGGEVSFSGTTKSRLVIRPNAFRRCIGNLLSNALRYAEKVSVTAARRGKAVEITIDDDGPGIDEADREDVFRPFHRLDPSRNPSTGGVGLGLTIARDVVRGHGGDLTLHTSPAGGLRAVVRLPL